MKKFSQQLFIVLFSIGLLVASCGHSDTSDMEAEHKMTSDEIVNAFMEDEQAANQKFIDHIIEVSGPIMEMNKENGKVTGLKLSSDEFNIVNCTFQEPVDPARLTSDKATIKGVCSGFLGDSESMLPGGTVEFKRSALVETK